MRYAIPPAAPQKACRSCTAPIYWIVTPRGASMPVNPDGSPHWSTCHSADQHRRPRT